jgi:hypothetical protein
MPAWERASVFETTQIGVEALATPGTIVPALRRLLCTTIRLNPNIPVEPYTPQGSKAATTATHAKEWTTGDVEGRGCFNDLALLLTAGLCVPTITSPGAGTVRRWNFKPKTWQPDSFRTWTLERGSGAGYAERAGYMLLNSFGLRLTPEEASVSGNILAQEPDYTAQLSTNEQQRVNLDGATGGTFTLAFNAVVTGNLAFNITASALQTALEALSTVGAGNVYVTVVSPGLYQVEFRRALGQTNVASLVLDDTLLTGDGGGAAVTTLTAGVPPVDVAEVPFDTDQVSIWTGVDVAGLARLRRVAEFEWGWSDRFTGQFTLDDEENSFSTAVEKAPSWGAQVTMQRNADFQELLGYLRAKTTRFWRLQVLGPVIEAGFPYRFSLTFPEKSREPRHGSNQDVESGQFELFNVYDSVFAGFVEVEIDCTLTGP